MLLENKESLGHPGQKEQVHRLQILPFFFFFEHTRTQEYCCYEVVQKQEIKGENTEIADFLENINSENTIPQDTAKAVVRGKFMT